MYEIYCMHYIHSSLSVVNKHFIKTPQVYSCSETELWIATESFVAVKERPVHSQFLIYAHK